ncbi:MAG: hypothetical protein ACM3SX_01555 [Deltaproteobacteria bacterium]
MRAYLWITGTIFGSITVAHVWRMVSESRSLAKDPFFILLTVISAILCVWAASLVRSSSRF